MNCSICKINSENVSPLDLVEKFGWIGMGKNRNGKETLHWYCSKHSIKTIFNYDEAINEQET